MFSTLSVLLLAGAWSPLLAVDIPESCEINTLYREMGCTPIFNDGSKCPIAYDCGNFEKLSPSVCYYNGKSYAKGASLPPEDSIDPCSAACHCSESYSKEGTAEWRCADIECPEQFNRTSVECVDLYANVKSCCRNNKYCAGKEPEPSFKCNYKGKTYVKGAAIDDEQKCRKCICDEHFTDTLEGPSCEVMSCGHMLHYIGGLRDGCVPVDFETSHCSCPIELRCPETTDTVAQSTKDSDYANNSGKTCKFGNLTLKVGEKLVKKAKEQFECSCNTPPRISCIRKRED